MFPGKEACHQLTFRKANNIHAWKPKKHDFVLADLALVNLLVNGASGKEPGHINPCWLMFAYLHTHMLTEFTYTCQPDPVWKNQSVLSTPLGCFTCSTWTVCSTSHSVCYHVLPGPAEPVDVAGLLLSVTPHPGHRLPRRGDQEKMPPEVLKGWCESVNIIPSQHYRKYLPVKILISYSMTQHAQQYVPSFS